MVEQGKGEVLASNGHSVGSVLCKYTVVVEDHNTGCTWMMGDDTGLLSVIESALKTSEEYVGHWTAFGHLLFVIKCALKTSEEYGGHWTAFGY